MAEVDQSDAVAGKEGRGIAQGNGASDEASTGIAVLSEGEPESSVEQPKRVRPASFSEMLVEAGMLSADQVKRAQDAASRDGLPLPRLLVRDGLVMSRDLAAFTALHMGLTMVDLRGEALEPEVVAEVPEETASKYTVLALHKPESTEGHRWTA